MVHFAYDSTLVEGGKKEKKEKEKNTKKK